MCFKIAIIGRPNVGKSTLFNRLTGRNQALVDNLPGVTRDRREGEGALGDLNFTIIDTAGLENAKSTTLEARMRLQTEIAMRQADLIFFLIDARVGILPDDEEISHSLRCLPQIVTLLANKYEGQSGEAGYLEAYRLGLGNPIKISAEHGHGMGELYTIIRDMMEERDLLNDTNESLSIERNFDPDAPFELNRTLPLRVAVLGRPNAGKSTLINYLLGEERLLTGVESGITRDSIGVEWQWRDIHNKQPDRVIQLWDTAGIRRKSRIFEKLEKLSVADGLRAVNFSEVVILLIDATTAFDKQDIQLADMVEREGRAMVIAINKWDLKLDRHDIKEKIRNKLEFSLAKMKGIPVIMLSAKTGQGVEKLMPAVMRQWEIWNIRIPTAQMNKWLAMAVAQHNPPADKGRAVKMRYITQVKSRPPTFATFSGRAHAVPESYIRYLTKSLRETFDLFGVPIRFFIRKGKNPYVDKR